MNRLTRKHKPTNYTRYTEKTICLKNYNIRSANLNKAIEKLGRLEDLQEELGCPLEVLNSAKAMVLKNEEVYEVNISHIDFNNGIIAFGSPWSFTTRKTKDYGKTWWLKGEKENE